MLICAQGAERPVRLPGELARFQGLPMRVVFAEGPEGGAPVADKARTAPAHVTRLGVYLAQRPMAHCCTPSLLQNLVCMAYAAHRLSPCREPAAERGSSAARQALCRRAAEAGCTPASATDHVQRCLA